MAKHSAWEKRFSGVPFESAIERVQELKPLVPEGMTMAQMAMRWILDYPAVTTVIAGASRPEQVVENASASDLEPLSQPLHRKLAEFYRRKVKPEIQVPV
jgi:aryl-alcohol dehydrogenase-like predicted oxidoreductase